MFVQPKNYRTPTTTAFQWKGDNLTEMQDALSPASPLFQVDYCGGQLGLIVGGQLRFAKRTDWIVNRDGQILIMTDDEFHNYYEPATPAEGDQ
jgi:hypothetical protein